MTKKTWLYRSFSLIAVAAVFFFLGKTLFDNWQKIREYQFSFNYSYLAVSWIFLTLAIIALALIWKKIFKLLDPKQEIANFAAFKIFISAWFGKYVPGKLWQPLGIVYLGKQQGLGTKPLAVSVILDNVLSLVAAFLLSFLFLGAKISQGLANFYILGAVIIVGGLVFIHPRIFYPVLNFILRRLKAPALSIQEVPLLTYSRIIQLIFYYGGAYLLNGLGFYFLINSLTFLPWSETAGVIAAFTLANTVGVLAIFAPSGLGVREGILAGFLQLYFPLSLAVLISLVARIWATVPEIILFLFASLFSKLKRRLPEAKNNAN